ARGRRKNELSVDLQYFVFIHREIGTRTLLAKISFSHALAGGYVACARKIFEQPRCQQQFEVHAELIKAHSGNAGTAFAIVDYDASAWNDPAKESAQISIDLPIGVEHEQGNLGIGIDEAGCLRNVSDNDLDELVHPERAQVASNDFQPGRADGPMLCTGPEPVERH